MLVYMANSGGGCVSPNLLPFLMFRSQNIFPQIFKKPANLLGTGNCDGVEYLIELPHWNILSALPNPAAAHNSNLALGYHLIKSKSVYEPYFPRPSSLFFFL